MKNVASIHPGEMRLEEFLKPWEIGQNALGRAGSALRTRQAWRDG